MQTREIVVRKNVAAETRDGVVLMADVYRPAEEGEYPVLLTRLPYGKDLPRDTTYFDPIRAAQAGYVVVVQDVRGRYASGGQFVPFVHEYEDGYDAVEWAAKLPGADGTVGMFGLSYFGKTQWQAAAMQPPSLKSMVPGITWGNHLNGVQMRGGVQELGVIFFWGLTTIAPEALFRKYRTEPQEIGAKMPGLIGTIDALLAGGGYDVLPLSKLPDPDGVVPFVKGGFARGVDDESWDYVNIDGKYDGIDIPTFHVGGWYDCFIGETLQQYGIMKKHAKEAGRRAPHLLVGPWTHGAFGSTFGELDFGVGSSGAFIDYRGDMTEKHLRWFDATLKNDESALQDTPPVQVFVMGENRWRSYEEWPPPAAREEEWHLRAGGGLTREAGGPGEEPARYDYDPQHPVPTVGGATLMAPIHGAGARDQRAIEERPDVLTFTSDPFAENYTLLGPAHATLFAASSAPDTDFVARLVDVYPDGRAIGVADGIVRASARESYPAPGVVRPTPPSPIEPGEVYELCVDLWAAGVTLLRGHRLRVDITSSSHPRWERNLNTGESAFHSDKTEVAHQEIFRDRTRPSRVTLTVVDN